MLGFWGKTPKNPDTPSSFFDDFWGSGHTGGWDPIYCGEVKIVDFEVKRSIFGGFFDEFCSMRKIPQISNNYGGIGYVTGKS